MGSPPLSLHYCGFGLNPYVDDVQTPGRMLPAVFPKIESFEPGHNMDTEDDEGHTGQDTVLLGKDRTQASAALTIKDKVRLGEGIEDFIFMLCGKYDTVVPAITGATSSYKWVIYRDTSDPPEDLPFGTVMEGFNWGDAKPEAYVEAMIDSLTFNLNANAAPSYEAKFLSDFPLYNQAEPTLVFPATETRFKAYQTSIYVGPVGASYATLKTDTYKLDCYTEANLNLKNNLEGKVCGGMTFGEIDKNRKPFTGDGTIKMDYNANNMNLEAEWATGATDGEQPTSDSLYKQILMKTTGKLIETVGSAPGTPVYADMEILLPKVEVTEVTSPRSGKEFKDITMKYEIVANAATLTNPVKFTIISPLDDLNYGSAPT